MLFLFGWSGFLWPLKEPLKCKFFYGLQVSIDSRCWTAGWLAKSSLPATSYCLSIMWPIWKSHSTYFGHFLCLQGKSGAQYCWELGCKLWNLHHAVISHHGIVWQSNTQAKRWKMSQYKDNTHRYGAIETEQQLCFQLSPTMSRVVGYVGESWLRIAIDVKELSKLVVPLCGVPISGSSFMLVVLSMSGCMCFVFHFVNFYFFY